MGSTSGLRQRVLDEVGKIVVDRGRETELLLVALLAGGHALVEGVPGVSKTLLAKSFSKCLGLSFRRVQFTPDMLPLDLVGGFIFNVKEREFEFRKGPVFTNILLADEINRAPPKVQSALLESMQEHQVTVEGHTEALPSPFMVLATQNPLEFEGVYPLPEGQLDRFMVRLTVSYPSIQTEAAVIRRNIAIPPVIEEETVTEVVSRDELLSALAGVRSVKVSDEMVEYLARIARETREDERVGLGVSPRATVQLTQCSRARAYLLGRDYVIPDDVKELSTEVISHRLKLAQGLDLTTERPDERAIAREIVDRVRPPR